MRAYVLAFVLAAVTTACLTPLVRRFAVRVGAVSKPGGRNVNERSIPRLGGIAIFVGFLVPLLTIFQAESVVAAALRAEWRKIFALLAGALVLTTVGALDDTRRIRAIYKLLAQIAVATLAYGAGYHIDSIQLPLIGDLSMGVFACPVTVIWIVGIVNAVNLIDGLDGLAGGIVFFAGVTNFVVAYVTQDIFGGALMATLLGAVLGFLFFNFNPARIFMGDSGSYFLGFVLGTVSVGATAQKTSTAVSILVPILALGVPIFDTLFTMIRRFVERRPIFAPDRGHVHHRLLDMGITHRRAVLILYGVSIVFTVAAVGVSLGKSWQIGVAILAASVVLVGMVRFLGYFEYAVVMRRQRARLRNPDTEALRRALPQVPQLFAAAYDERSIFDALAAIRALSGLVAIELVADDSIAVRWRGETAAMPSELVSAKFPIGEEPFATAELRFRWESETGDVAPQSEVLLQVITDIAAAALARAGSKFAARAPESNEDLIPDRASRPIRVES